MGAGSDLEYVVAGTHQTVEDAQGVLFHPLAHERADPRGDALRAGRRCGAILRDLRPGDLRFTYGCGRRIDGQRHGPVSIEQGPRRVNDRSSPRTRATN